MNKTGRLLHDLHEAETDLASEYRTVAERQAADHGTYYPCRTLAEQCDRHAERVRAAALRYGRELSPPKHPIASAMGGLLHRTSELLGRRPEAGLLLLADLRTLYLGAQAVSVHWILLGQAAQALRDGGLLEEVNVLHKETLTQIKWLKTRLKDASPQVLVVPD